MGDHLGSDLLAGKNLLITGIITEASMAFHTARLAQQQGANVVLTGYGRLSLVERIAKRLPAPAPVVELDVTDRSQLDSLADRVGEHVDRLDGVLHSIGFAPQTALGGRFLKTGWDDVAIAVHVSAFSLKSLAVAALPRMGPGGSIVGLTFDATVAWPVYDWMGVAKAAFESTARYLARELGPQGITVNLVQPGPVDTEMNPADGGELADTNKRLTALGRYGKTAEIAAVVAFLAGPGASFLTGSIVTVDGGYNA